MWQINGRSDITDFEEVVRLDAEYIEMITHYVRVRGYSKLYDSTYYGVWSSPYSVMTDHSYGPWFVTDNDSCCTSGSERHNCLYYDHYETASIEPLGHNYVDGKCSRFGKMDPNYEPVSPIS